MIEIVICSDGLYVHVNGHAIFRTKSIKIAEACAIYLSALPLIVE